MATRFELVLHGANPVALRSAGEEAIAEIERLGRALSFYDPSSQISRVNARAFHEPVVVEPVVFELLQHAIRLGAETRGAFDITIGPLMRAWGLTGGGGRVPSARELAEARRCVGVGHIVADPANFTIRFTRPGVQIDLGSIGKGFAIERAAEILRELGVRGALIHGGTSTVCAIGAPPGAKAWNIAIDQPGPPVAPGEPPAAPMAIVPLRAASLSVSAVWGKSFTIDGRTYGHVIDPRTGKPVRRAQLAAVVTRSAAESDAFSTALLTLGPAGIDTLAALRPRLGALVVGESVGSRPPRIEARRIELLASSPPGKK